MRKSSGERRKTEGADPRFAPGARHEGMRARAVGSWWRMLFLRQICAL